MKKIIPLIICILMFFTFPVSAENGYYVVDSDGLLSKSEIDDLQQKAEKIKEKYDFEIVFLTFNNLEFKDIKTYTADFFMDNGYGVGENRDGLILSVYDGRNRDVREFCSAGHGYGEVATGEYFYESLFDESDVVDKLSDEDFYGAFCDYIDLADKFLAAYESGNPYGEYQNSYEDPGVMNTGFSLQQILIGAAVILAVSLIAAAVYVAVLKKNMNNARPAGAAHDYIRSGSFKLFTSRDLYLYSTVSKVKIETDNDSKSGGSFSSSGGSSFSGGSSRF